MPKKQQGGQGKRRKEPKVYESVDELEAAIDAYFEKCDASDTLYSDAGLSLALDVVPQTLERWRKGEQRPEFCYVVQRAFLRIAEQIQTHPAYMQKGMVSMAVFKLKQEKFGGYQDRIEAKQDIAVQVKMGTGMDETDFK